MPSEIKGSSNFDSDSAGKVLQVVTASKTDTFSTTSVTPVIIPSLSVSITPTSASSTIFVSVNIGKSTNGTGTASSSFYIYRDSTAILIGAAAGSRPRASFTMGGISGPAHGTAGGMSGIDSPASTAAITYALYADTQGGGTTYVNRTASDNNAADSYNSRSISTITVMEIGA